MREAKSTINCMDYFKKKKLIFPQLTIRNIAFTLLLALVVVLSIQPKIIAHSPHDHIYDIDISPNYSQDKTVYTIVRGNLLKSTNNGESWQRIVRGLNNRSKLRNLAISPTNPQNLYLSSVADGVYKSVDGGESWVRNNRGLEQTKLNLIAISPHSDEQVLVAGKNQDLYKTDDGGETWQKVLDSNKITAIALFPNDKNKIIIGDSQGLIYTSIDAGNSWQKNEQLKDNGSINSIKVSQNSSQNYTIFFATNNGGVFRTKDFGKSLTELNNGLTDLQIRDIEILPDANLLVSSWHNGIYYSNNTGESWQLTSNKNLTKDIQADENIYLAPHFNEIAISDNFREDNTIFLAGFDGLFRSTNGGNSWQELDTLSPRIVTTLDISPNYANDSTIIFGTYNNEAYLSSNGGENWQPIDKGLDIARYQNNAIYQSPYTIYGPRYYSLVFSPNYVNDRTIFGSLRYQYIRSIDGGKSWEKISIRNLPGHSLREIIVVPSPAIAEDQTVYLATYSGSIHISTNNGAKFSSLGEIGSPIRSFIISPNFKSDRTLYASSYEGGIYQSVDGGKSWNNLIKDENLQQKSWWELAISPNYEADSTLFAGSNQGIYKSENKGKTWQKLTGNSVIENGWIRAIAISPNYSEDQSFIITIKGLGVFKTVNGGESFSQIAQDLWQKNYSLLKVDNVPSTSVPIKFSPNYAEDKTIYGYGAITAEIFKSTDGGTNWEIIYVPQQEDKFDKALSQLKLANLFFKVNPLWGYLLAIILAMCSYFIVGFLKLEKQLPLNRLQIKITSSVIIFMLIIFLVS